MVTEKKRLCVFDAWEKYGTSVFKKKKKANGWKERLIFQWEVKDKSRKTRDLDRGDYRKRKKDEMEEHFGSRKSRAEGGKEAGGEVDES